MLIPKRIQLWIPFTSAEKNVVKARRLLVMAVYQGSIVSKAHKKVKTLLFPKVLAPFTGKRSSYDYVLMILVFQAKIRPSRVTIPSALSVLSWIHHDEKLVSLCWVNEETCRLFEENAIMFDFEILLNVISKLGVELTAILTASTSRVRTKSSNLVGKTQRLCYP